MPTTAGFTLDRLRTVFLPARPIREPPAAPRRTYIQGNVDSGTGGGGGGTGASPPPEEEAQDDLNSVAHVVGRPSFEKKPVVRELPEMPTMFFW
jgi:hypothetical protein